MISALDSILNDLQDAITYLESAYDTDSEFGVLDCSDHRDLGDSIVAIKELVAILEDFADEEFDDLDEY